jgi:ABC-type glycerol-3-phosphate transport system substrate-binding protein
MKTFQTVLLAVFGFFIVAGVIAVASYGKFGGFGNTTVPAEGVIWGTLDQNTVQGVIDLFNQDNDNTLNITYEQFSEDTFDDTLTEALAEGRGPDMIIIGNDRLLQHEKKLYAIPFASLSERLFRDTYIEGAELYIGQTGIVALPILIDPMVMYWNRTLFNSAGIARPPKLWEEVTASVPKLTKSDSAFNITQSAVALGEHKNVLHAKEILATMIMQAGNPITIQSNGRFQSILNDRLDLPEVPADAATRFYTEFSNPVKPSYSWNRALPLSKDAFVRGDVAMYLGFANELFGIQEQNPNLNFDVTRMPQVRDAVDKATFGEVYAIAVLAQSKKIPNAFVAATTLAGPIASPLWSDAFALPPARRDMLSQVPTDPYKTVFYQDALIARGFYDADPVQTDTIFASLIEDVTSGRLSVSQAVSEADGRMDRLLAK